MPVKAVLGVPGSAVELMCWWMRGEGEEVGFEGVGGCDDEAVIWGDVY